MGIVDIGKESQLGNRIFCNKKHLQELHESYHITPKKQLSQFCVPDTVNNRCQAITANVLLKIYIKYIAARDTM